MATHHCNRCGGPTSFVRLMVGWGWTCNYCPAWGNLGVDDGGAWALRAYDNDREP